MRHIACGEQGGFGKAGRKGTGGGCAWQGRRTRRSLQVQVHDCKRRVQAQAGRSQGHTTGQRPVVNPCMPAARVWVVGTRALQTSFLPLGNTGVRQDPSRDMRTCCSVWRRPSGAPRGSQGHNAVRQPLMRWRTQTYLLQRVAEAPPVGHLGWGRRVRATAGSSSSRRVSVDRHAEILSFTGSRAG